MDRRYIITLLVWVVSPSPSNWTSCKKYFFWFSDSREISDNTVSITLHGRNNFDGNPSFFLRNINIMNRKL